MTKSAGFAVDADDIPLATIRESAALLRERSERASSGPWSAANEHGLLGPDATPAWYVSQMRPGYQEMSPQEGYVTDIAEVFGNDRDTNPNAEYIATLDPDVGLALADVLDIVTAWEEEGLGKPPERSNYPDAWDDVCAAVLRLSALIGEPS